MMLECPSLTTLSQKVCFQDVALGSLKCFYTLDHQVVTSYQHTEINALHNAREIDF